MQKGRTLDFWDAYYDDRGLKSDRNDRGRGIQDADCVPVKPRDVDDGSAPGEGFRPSSSASSSGTQEWILQPTDALLDLLCRQLFHPMSGNSVIDGEGRLPSLRFLEIGAGTSGLSRDLFAQIRALRQERNGVSPKQPSGVSALVTDVSPVCIRQNQDRDMDFMKDAGESFRYEVLNIADPPSEALRAAFDFILDKGCLDTFLFRTRHRGRRRKEILVKDVLDNLYLMLKAQEHCCALILSPRSHARPIREHNGFACERHKLDRTTFGMGDLDGGKMESREALYLYVCRKRLGYDPSAVVPEAEHELSDDDTCPTCLKTFRSFRGGHHRLENRGKQVWFREWTGHKAHCKSAESASPVAQQHTLSIGKT